MMRLRKLDLTRFGHFTGRDFDFGSKKPGRSDFHVIYGPNESGKSTLMEGYLRLLYGFLHQEPFAFKHPANTLQIGGKIEIDGRIVDLVRIKRIHNSLLDQHGDPVPETILQAPLSGLASDDYRNMFCLDDHTIEAGGKEILQSKGDIGTLLFSAASGLGNLSAVMDRVRDQADAFYRKGASKTKYARLKKNLDDISGQIKQADISAHSYRELRTALENAERKESECRNTRKTLEIKKNYLRALIDSYPDAGKYREIYRDLEPLLHYPESVDIDPETLVAMVSDRAGLEVALTAQHKVITKAKKAKKKLNVRPDLLALKYQFKALDKHLRGRAEGAVADLPKRRQEKEDLLEEMRKELAKLQISHDAEPADFVLSKATISGLERLSANLGDAEKDLKTAKSEERKARLAKERAEEALKRAEAEITIGPEIEELLMRHDAGHLVESWRDHKNAIAAASKARDEKLRKLSRMGVVFPRLPDISLTLDQAENLAGKFLKTGQRLETVIDAETSCREEHAALAARLDVLRQTADLVTDEEADVTRRERDRHWAIHRGKLTLATAKSFEKAMHMDDRSTKMRLAQSARLGQLQTTQIAEREAGAKLETAETKTRNAKKEAGALEAELKSWLKRLGLPDKLSANDLLEWVRRHEEARNAQEELVSAEAAAAEIFEAADRLRRELAGLIAPGDENADISALYKLGLHQAEIGKVQLAKCQSAKEALQTVQDELKERIGKRKDCEKCFAEAQFAEQEASIKAFPDGMAPPGLREALPILRSLREINESLTGITRQIDGMRKDLDEFEAQMDAILASLPDKFGKTPLKNFYQLKTAIEEAERTGQNIRELEKNILKARDEEKAAKEKLISLDKKTKALAGIFPDNIATSSLDELRAAVKNAHKANQLRKERADLRINLLTRMGAASIEDVFEKLGEHLPKEAENLLANTEKELEETRQALETAIENRTMAQNELERVHGDADVARLVEKRRAIEMQMEDGLFRYLENRLGHMLAGRALHRYRDVHRSGMLKATESAFRTLTGNAYTSLSTHPEGTKETLIAITSESGRSKEAAQMSKGTRFQLYLALRAAAYEQMAANGTILPFFCDDVFETFDEERTTAACRLMHKIGQTGQAIYLTHHAHVIEIARDICEGDVTIHQLKLPTD